MLVCTLGDLLLDVVVRLGAPLEAGSDAPAQTSLSAGGQAANVAAWAVALGAHGRLVCRRGGDGAAQLAEEALAGLGVEIVGPRAGGRGGVVVSLVDPQGDRTMASDRGVSPGLQGADIDPGWLSDADALHLSGYSLLREPIAGAARRAASLARASGTRVSVDLAAAPLITTYGASRFRGELGELGPDVVFATVSEEDALGGPLPGAIWVRKRGAGGCEVLHGDERLALPAESGPVIDSTGAGDALAAGFLVGGDLASALRSGLAAAARCVATVGAMPHRVGPEMSSPLRITGEILDALATAKGVVALETTLVAHGFPAGEGAKVGAASERAVRASGAVPATIGVLDGEVRVGLDAATISTFDRAGSAARKLGPRDLAACCVQRALGATTVGGTLAVCRPAGIRVMATGGLGGVHRGFARRPDVSADLGELARAPVIVVCSGVKSLLDVPATCELLETLGIPVLGYRTDELPLFYAARGGPPVSARVEDVGEAAAIAMAHWGLGRTTAVVLARPPDDSLDDAEPLIEDALALAEERGVRGQDVTPFVLDHLHRASGGRTLRANRELVAGNAALAGEVAVALAALGRG